MTYIELTPFEFSDDQDLWWLWCGDEASAIWVGPFPTQAAADEDAKATQCDHSHVSFRMTVNQALRHLPAVELFTETSFLYIQVNRGSGDRRRPIIGAGRGVSCAWSQPMGQTRVEFEVLNRIVDLHDQLHGFNQGVA